MATTRRQDRVLHGFAKALNVVIGLLALPAWLFGQRISGRLRDVLAARGARQTRSLPTPPQGERSMAAVMEELRAIPQDLRASQARELRKGLADISTFVLSQQAEVTGLGYAYPSQFASHVFAGGDGERIAATIGLHDDRRPALIVVHGVFTSSRFDYVRQIAVRAYYEWGFNVAAIDLRSFGLTEMTTSAPSTAGWKEGEDIVALARYMKGLGSTSVGTLGISLGGSSVLGASYADGAEEVLEGGVLAVSPPAEPRVVAERLSRKVPRKHPAYALNYGFHAMLTSRVRSARWPDEVSSMDDALAALAPPYYGLSADEIWERASAVNYIGGTKVPVLILHPTDDKIIKVEEAEKLERAAAGNDLVRVWKLPAGSHGALDAMDSRWTYAVYRRYFERWASYPEPRVIETPRERELGLLRG
ncbi:MAG: serine aminopeptidase domain-containing protein [Solirubrobacterales bacterium]